MKTFVVLALALVSSTAFARPNTTDLTCRDASGLVAEQGAINLNVGAPGLFERFVANRGFCGGFEQARPAYVATLDNASCKIGYVCEVGDRGGNSVAKKIPAAYGKCEAGSYSQARADAYFPEYAGKDKVPNITVVCTAAGKWVPANKAWKAPVTKGGQVCKNGDVSWYPSAPSRDDRFGKVKSVCVNGKWIKQ